MKFFYYILLLYSGICFSKSLVELGVGSVNFYSPQYPGSEENRLRSAFLPLVIYRGETVYADEEGIKSDLSSRSWYNLELSVAAAFPADSEGNKARAGMEDLDWLVEIGPNFEIHLYKRKDEIIDLRLQVRAVISSDISFTKHQGHVLHPMFYYENTKFFGGNLEFVLRLGSIWANQGVADYFYEVGQKDVTASRPRYDARAGLIETHFDIGFIYEFSPRFRSFLGFQNNFYSKAKNIDSPLHLRDRATSIGLGFTWTFYKSDKQSKL